MDKIWSPLHGRRALILGDVSLGLIRHVAGRYENVVVLDTLFRPLTQAADLSTLLNARHAEIDHPPLPWDPGYFDGVFSLNFLFPRMDWSVWLREALRVLKPRGRALIVEPYPSFQRPLGSTVKIIKMWKDLISELPPALPDKFVSQDEITAVLKDNDIHHLRVHGSLDVLGSDAHDWLPTPWVRDTFLKSFLPGILQSGINQTAREMIDEFSKAFNKRSQLDLPVSIFSGVKRPERMRAFAVTDDEQLEMDLETETTPAEEEPEEILDSDPFKVIWAHGPETMTDAGLLSVVLAEDDVPDDLLKACKEMLGQYGSVALARENAPRKLAEAFKLDRRQAIRLIAAFELGRRFLSPTRQQEVVLNTSDDVFKYLEDMGSLKKEHLRGLYLDARGRLLLDEVLALGSLTTSTVHGRDVFLPALKCYATAIILAHNHPSGEPDPSPEDIQMTKKLKEAGQILGIDVVDHIVVTETDYVSMSDKKLM